MLRVPAGGSASIIATGRVAMTRSDHPSGTDRVAEVAAGLKSEVIINLQGDEPLLDAKSLDLLAALLEREAVGAPCEKRVPAFSPYALFAETP